MKYVYVQEIISCHRLCPFDGMYIPTQTAVDRQRTARMAEAACVPTIAPSSNFAGFCPCHKFTALHKKTLQETGVVVVDNFFEQPRVDGVRKEVEELPLTSTVQPKTTRSDRIAWVHENQHGFKSIPSAVKCLKGIGHCFEDVLGKLDAPSRCMAAVYEGKPEEEQNGYRVHLDNCPPKDDDLYWLWRSSREQSDRKLTSILYLNDSGWEDDGKGSGNGGNLRCYLGCDKGDDSGATAKGVQDIAPVGGRLVVFLSQNIPHEVLPTAEKRKRVALSCWHLDGGAGE